MKKLIIVFVTFLTVCCLLAPTAALAFTSDILDQPSFTYTLDGFSYKEASFTENGALQKIFYGEYNTTQENAKYEWVIHSIRSGSETTRSTVMEIATDYEQSTGRKVIFAANGDYFDLNTGANMESYVNNGIVVSKGSFATKHCIGFDNNGNVAIGRMTEVEKRLAVYTEGKPTFFTIDKFNQQPSKGEIAVYDTVGSFTVSDAGVTIVNTDEVNLSMYPVFGVSNTTVNGVKESKSFTLKSGQFAVVYTSEDEEFFSAHSYGCETDLVEIPSGQYQGCTWVLGGYDILVNDYVVNTNCHTDNSGNVAAPRTLIGFKEDGTGFLCMLDGRQPSYAVGVTVNQQAQIAAALGARYALELDGGGSTTVLVRIDDVLTLRNKPSDGSMRKVSNAIMLVEVDEQSDVTENPDDKPVNPDDPVNPDGKPVNPDGGDGTTSETPPALTWDFILAIVLCCIIIVLSVVSVIILVGKKGKKGGK